VLQQCKSERRIHAHLSHRVIGFAAELGKKYEDARALERRDTSDIRPTVSIDGKDAI
jgi:hypothetical protein